MNLITHVNNPIQEPPTNQHDLYITMKESIKYIEIPNLIAPDVMKNCQ